ncbi:hypothetical protein BGZ99_004533 [Dissophora globulifera]|uniref:Uncharacterized protein n=1 Tax=Dissophora globulifera TaxID=979702 RepID=A0A9P6RM98_9FUNG|nr:hypothetical protein BGZ99_004533 [Dissophora globulifera]
MDHTLDTNMPGYNHVTLSSPPFISCDTSAGFQTTTPFVSLQCKPTLSALPPELLSRIGLSLSLCEYSYLSRACARLHRHLFHPSELVYFLKTRYRLSVESGSIIIFAYLSNMRARAPLLLERIFEDFFADSPLRLQEEERWKRQCQQQRRLLNQHTYQLNQAITSNVSGGGIGNGANIIEVQRLDSLQAHQAAEKARRQAKWDAVRMLGVLYALDKTHVGPSSSTNALALSGASDLIEQRPASPTSNVEGSTFCSTAYPQKQQHDSTSPVSPLVDMSLSAQSCSTVSDLDPATASQHTIEQIRPQQTIFGSPIETDHRLCRFQSERSRPQCHQDRADFLHLPGKSMRRGYSAFVGGKDTNLPSTAQSSRDSSSSIELTQSTVLQQSKQRRASAIRPNRRLRPNRRSEDKRTRDRALSEGQGVVYHLGHKSWLDSDLDANREYIDLFSDDDGEGDDEDEKFSTMGDTVLHKETSTSLRSTVHIPTSHDGYSTTNFDRCQSLPTYTGCWTSTEDASPAFSSLPLPMEIHVDKKQTMVVPDKPTESTQQQQQQVLSRVDKIAFLTKYTDRMHLRLQALGIKDWSTEDIQRKKTYQLMIQHNDKTGEKDLVDFYLGRYGGSVVSLQQENQPQPQPHHHGPAEVGITTTFMDSAI